MATDEFPDRFAQGFLEASRLRSLSIATIRIYERGESHAGFTLFAPDEQSDIFVQMFQLPAGRKKFKDDLAFQTSGKKWGKPLKQDVLQLNIFPKDWAHEAFPGSPRRIVHSYRGPNHAVFFRYQGESLDDPLFTQFNAHLRYLPDAWHAKTYEWRARRNLTSSRKPVSMRSTCALSRRKSAR